VYYNIFIDYKSARAAPAALACSLHILHFRFVRFPPFSRVRLNNPKYFCTPPLARPEKSN
jgi:hypothetical protein